MGSWNLMGSQPWSKVEFNETINSSTPMERAFAQLVIIMQKITNECKEDDETLCEHAKSHESIDT